MFLLLFSVNVGEFTSELKVNKFSNCNFAVEEENTI